ncbi:MAG: hypothetical protein AAF989_10105 [Planctomycetota bacterium]
MEQAHRWGIRIRTSLRLEKACQLAACTEALRVPKASCARRLVYPKPRALFGNSRLKKLETRAKISEPTGSAVGETFRNVPWEAKHGPLIAIETFY